MAVIELDGLRKEYRRVRGSSVVALNGLDLAVPQGGVFGFLGPNGSGKTTTIRCLLGLIRPTAGTCRILGADSQSELPRVVQRVGSLVETPGLFPGMTGRQNLALLGGLQGIGSRGVQAVLERVGMAERADDAVRGYSLGMRQRLGVGIALLKDPELLVLDEPANGLDPAGIKEVRVLLRSIGAEGRTVFLSSHLLGEVQQTCDEVAILAHGRCVATGRVEEVLAAGHSTGLLVRVRDLGRGVTALREAGFEASLQETHIRVALPPSEAEKVTRALVSRDMYVTELRPEEVSLETVFLELTDDARPAPE
jgi:ABC-2 type transport system ATP-binding protein